MKKLLVIILAVGMVCLAGVAFAQAQDGNAATGNADTGGANQNTDGGTGVAVTNPEVGLG